LFAVLKDLNKKNPEFTKVKDEIKRNNEIAGTVSAQAQLDAQAQARLGSEGTRPLRPEGNGLSGRVSESSSKKKPEVKAKPDFLSLRLSLG
jgi:ubiquitin carboxyl-terminal hydrolase 8